MDWSKADRDMVSRIAQEGETYLDGQLRLATSADQRASVLAGAFIAAATVVLGGLIALASGREMEISRAYPIYLGGGVTAIMFLIAAAFCIFAIFPVNFWLPGNQPESWYQDVKNQTDYTLALGEEAEYTQSKIDENRATIVRNAVRFKRGVCAGMAAPVLGTILWIVTSSSWWVAGQAVSATPANAWASECSEHQCRELPRVPR